MVGNNPISRIDLYGLKSHELEYDLLKPGITNLNSAESVSGFSAILADIKDKVGTLGEDSCGCIESIKIGGHGGPGLFYGDGDNMSNDNMLSNGDFDGYNRLKDRGEQERADQLYGNVAFMNQLAEYMCEGGTVTSSCARLTWQVAPPLKAPQLIFLG
jgi:hypothetical protein